jgi:hypothetical protein
MAKIWRFLGFFRNLKKYSIWQKRERMQWGPLFNMNDLEALRAIVSAGEAEKSPVMIAVSKGAMHGPWPENQVYYSNIPIGQSPWALNPS